MGYVLVNGLSRGRSGKESVQVMQETGSIPGSGRSPGGGNANPFSILACEIPWTQEHGGLHTIHGIAKSQT